MKTLLAYFLMLHVSASLARAQYDLPLTNGIMLSTQGIRLIITDNIESTNDFAADREVDADARVWWVLQNVGPNPWARVAFAGISNAFNSELRTTNGIPIRKTEKGKAMNAGPTPNKNFRISGPTSGTRGIRDFPILSELFEFPSSGVYLLEVRYWLWRTASKEFYLSDPVRLRVIKRDKSPPQDKVKAGP